MSSSSSIHFIQTVTDLTIQGSYITGQGNKNSWTRNLLAEGPLASLVLILVTFHTSRIIGS